MKRLQKVWMVLAVSMILLLASAVPVQAKSKTVNAKAYSLTDVRKAVKPKGTWVRKGDGIRFCLKSTGQSIKSKWFIVNNKIYYADSKGNRAQKCWVSYRGNMYRMNSKGEMMTGWMKLGGKTYYLRSDGIRVKGIRTISGKKYYFDKYGVRKTGWQKSGSSEYYFNAGTGVMVKSSWIKTGSKYYYVGSNGKKLKSCWLVAGKKRYYLGADGARVTGKVYIGDKGYYFKSNGVYDPTVKVKPQIDASKPMVALTFDDGPGPYTGRLLDCLQKNKAKATFFLVGGNVPSYGSTVKRMADLGMELGNHSYNHVKLTTLTASAIRSEIENTNRNIRNAAGKSPTLCRLPYGDGHKNSYVLNALGMPSVFWSIDPRDWANVGNPQHTINEVLNNVKSGDIILMHDVHLSTVQAAEKIIPELKRRGYQMVTVSQLAKYKGRTSLKNGKTYYHFK